MKTSSKGIDLIKQFEGCSLKAYLCPAGVWTIGYGNVSHAKKGMSITKAQAEAFLQEDIVPIEKMLNTMGINFKQNQFDSLASWVFNLGSGAFVGSTLCKKIQLGALDIEITDQIIRWVNAGGKPLLGLKRRRVAEANMWLGVERYYVDTNGNIKKR